MAAFDVPNRPSKVITMDFISPLPKLNGANSILVVVDKFSKYTTTISTTTDLSSGRPIEFLVRHIFLSFGIPKKLISNHGVLFMSNEFRS